MDRIYKRMRTLGYPELTEDDIEHLEVLAEKIKAGFCKRCNQEMFPEELWPKLADKVCGEFLYECEMAAGRAEDRGVELEQEVQSVKIGDVSVEYADDNTNRQRRAQLINELRNAIGEADIRCYRRFRWH